MRTYWLMLNFLLTLVVSLSIVAGIETEEFYNLVAEIPPANQTSHICHCLYKKRGPDWNAACHLVSGSYSEESGPNTCQFTCVKCFKNDEHECDVGVCGAIYSEKKQSATSKIWKVLCGALSGSCEENPDACTLNIVGITCCEEDPPNFSIGPCGIVYAAKQIGSLLTWKFLGGSCFGESEVQETSTNCKMGLCCVTFVDCKN